MYPAIYQLHTAHSTRSHVTSVFFLGHKTGSSPSPPYTTVRCHVYTILNLKQDISLNPALVNKDLILYFNPTMREREMLNQRLECDRQIVISIGLSDYICTSESLDTVSITVDAHTEGKLRTSLELTKSL